MEKYYVKIVIINNIKEQRKLGIASIHPLHIKEKDYVKIAIINNMKKQKELGIVSILHFYI